jgi:hypothetical protein
VAGNDEFWHQYSQFSLSFCYECVCACFFGLQDLANTHTHTHTHTQLTETLRGLCGSVRSEVYTHTYIHTYIYIYIYTHTHICTHVHIHTHTHSQVTETLKELCGSVRSEAPMQVVRFNEFEAFGELPRSSDNITELLSAMDDDVIVVFISHRWLRPWHTREECERNGHRCVYV